MLARGLSCVKLRFTANAQHRALDFGGHEAGVQKCQTKARLLSLTTVRKRVALGEPLPFYPRASWADTKLGWPLLKSLGTRNDIGYNASVAINRFRHKGLERFFTTGSKAGIQAKHAERLRLIPGRLNVATGPRDMDLPGLKLHELRGDRKGTWAVKVSGNWRVTFAFTGTDVDRVDCEDHH